MEIRPGDVVMLPVVMGMDESEIAELRDHLAETMPGVHWVVRRETMITSALVYRNPLGDVEAGNVAAVEISRLRYSLTTALDLLTKIAGTFTDKGSIGGIDNVLRSTWHDRDQVKGWYEWIDATREQLSVRPKG